MVWHGLETGIFKEKLNLLLLELLSRRMI